MMFFFRFSLFALLIFLSSSSIASDDMSISVDIIKKYQLSDKVFKINHSKFFNAVMNSNAPVKFRDLIKIDRIDIKYSNPRIITSGLNRLEVVDIDVIITANAGDIEQVMINEALPFVNALKTGRKDRAGISRLGKKSIEKNRMRFSIRPNGRDYNDKWPRTRIGNWNLDVWLDLSISHKNNRNDINISFNVGKSNIRFNSSFWGKLFRKRVKREMKKANRMISKNIKDIEKVLDDQSINFSNIGFFSSSKWTKNIVKKFKWTDSSISSSKGQILITAYRNTPKGISAKTAKWIDSSLVEFLSKYSKD